VVDPAIARLDNCFTFSYEFASGLAAVPQMEQNWVPAVAGDPQFEQYLAVAAPLSAVSFFMKPTIPTIAPPMMHPMLINEANATAAIS
jgi:hypothetical protein